MNIGIIILAAGNGSRMIGKIAKPLRQLAGKPLLAYNLALANRWAVSLPAISAGKINLAQVALVVNEGLAADNNLADLIEQHAASIPLALAIQPQPQGTANAVFCAIEQCSGLARCDFILTLYADNPLISTQSLDKLIQRALNAAEQKEALPDLINLAFTTTKNNRYGRLILDHANKIKKIQEFKEFAANLSLKTEQIPAYSHKASNDAQLSPELQAQLFPQAQLYNSGVIFISQRAMREFKILMQNKYQQVSLGALNSYNSEKTSPLNAEMYLTDAVEFVYQADALMPPEYIRIPEQEALGCNSNSELAILESIMQEQLRHNALENGVIMLAPDTVFFNYDTQIGAGTIVQPYVVFGARVIIGQCCKIMAFSHIEGANIQDNAQIGPFARIRPHSEIGEGVHIGNFVEVKNARLDDKVKAGHLSYLGDVDIGNTTNIGAGTVICNFDGQRKHRSTIGAHSFIGANNSIISPRKIGANSKTAAGSVITQDVPEGHLAIARAPQINKNPK